MKTLHSMVVKAFFPVLILSLLFFILILQLVDLFANLWRYLNQDVPLITIAEIAWLYLPKCVSFSLPLALLFSVSYTLGTLYSNNELISVFGSGISLYKFISPLIAVGFLLSFINIYFEEKIVIKSFREKNELTNTVLNQKVSYSNTNITVRDNKKNLIYHADYYNDNTGTLSGLIIIELDESGLLKKRIDSEEARWNGKNWELINCRIFSWKDDEGVMIQENKDLYINEMLDEKPDLFRKTIGKIEEMQIEEAQEWLNSLKTAGLPYREPLTEFYARFSFAFTPLIVSIISSAVGGRFKKNILLMSLLLSLILGVLYYVLEMILVLFAKIGYIPPLAGSWGAFVFFFFAGIVLFRFART